MAKSDRIKVIRVRVSPKTLSKWATLALLKDEAMDDIIYRMCERELRAYSIKARKRGGGIVPVITKEGGVLYGAVSTRILKEYIVLIGYQAT